MTKEELQKSAIELSKNNNTLALIWATGTGKSKASIDIQSSINSKSTFVAVAEVAHINNWESEYNKFNPELLESTEIVCYASLKRHINKEVDLLILDEAHRAVSTLRLEFLSSIKAKKIVILSATLTEDQLDRLSNVFGKIKRFNFTLEDAIDNKILPQPKVYLIPMDLDAINKTETIIFKRGLAKKSYDIEIDYADRWSYMTNKAKYPNIRLIMKATPEEKNIYYEEQIAYWRKRYFTTKQEFMKNKWLRTGSERKQFLGSLKTSIAYNLQDLLVKKKKRFIMFLSSIDQADKVGREHSVHSKKKNNDEIIKAFNDNKISDLYAVNMLQEGMNLSDIEVGVIMQLDGNERSFIQRTGRAMRADSPVQIIFYYGNTQDEVYLDNNVLSNIPPEYITKVQYIYDIKL